MVRKIVIFLVMTATLVACGGKSSKEETSASFQLFVGAVSDPNLAGGVMVYGREAAGETFAINVTSDTLQFPIPNGNWNFYAFGWSGPNDLEGTLRCGEASAELNGGDAVVSFTLNSANCNNGNYGSAAYLTGDQVRPLRIVHCTDITGVVNGTSDCNGILSGTESFRIEMATFGAVPSPSLQAACVDDADAVTGITNTNLKIPTGGFFADFLSVRISTYRNTGCAGGASATYNFSAGLEANLSSSVLHPDGANTVLFLDAPATIIVPGIALNPSANHVKEVTNASYKLKNMGVGVVIKKQDITNANYKLKISRKAEVTKPKFTESASTNYKIHVGSE